MCSFMVSALVEQPLSVLTSKSPPSDMSVLWREEQNAALPSQAICRSFPCPVDKHDFDSHCRVQVPTGNNHPRSNSRSIDSEFAEYMRFDGEEGLVFQFQTLKQFNVNRKGWLHRERALLIADRKAAGKHRRVSTRKKVVLAPRARPRYIDDVCDSESEGEDSTVSVTPTSPVQNIERIHRTVTREDKDFASIPDYCPALSSLSGGGSLEIDWSYQPLNLDHDPHASLLHADELQLAEILRLDCATYITSKRRIFQRRLECLRVGKEFLKTDAQRACKIDVNKASKMWTAFQKVGWLRKDWVQRFL